ncbi:MAG: hypothetical protein K1X78_27620 [Verrucomicrobiaceae bacterium]|nr:hypothetical protein [Verrucomicrobiaceae bacterium]
MRRHAPTILLLFIACTLSARADLKLPAIIGDHMVLQQNLSDPIWGWDQPGTEVTVTFDGQTKKAKADDTGKWATKLDAMPANANPQSMTIKGSTTRELKNVLVGEVWICAGQSNMQFAVGTNWDADLEIAAAKHPQIFISSPCQT